MSLDPGGGPNLVLPDFGGRYRHGRCCRPTGPGRLGGENSYPLRHGPACQRKLARHLSPASRLWRTPVSLPVGLSSSEAIHRTLSTVG